MKQSRKSLFKKRLVTDITIEKEWYKLILNDIGLSKFINLLLKHKINDNIWNIIIEYVTPQFPVFMKCRIISYTGYYGDISDGAKVCYQCKDTSRSLIANTRLLHNSYYSIMCAKCINNIASSSTKYRRNVHKLTTLYNKFTEISSLSPELRNILTWIGFIDFDYIHSSDTKK